MYVDPETGVDTAERAQAIVAHLTAELTDRYDAKCHDKVAVVTVRDPSSYDDFLEAWAATVGQQTYGEHIWFARLIGEHYLAYSNTLLSPQRARKIATELGLLPRKAASPTATGDIIDLTGGISDATGNIIDLTANVNDATGNVIDLTDNVNDAMGDVNDATSNIIDLTRDVNDVIEAKLVRLFSADEVPDDCRFQFTASCLEMLTWKPIEATQLNGIRACFDMMPAELTGSRPWHLHEYDGDELGSADYGIIAYDSFYKTHDEAMDALARAVEDRSAREWSFEPTMK